MSARRIQAALLGLLAALAVLAWQAQPEGWYWRDPGPARWCAAALALLGYLLFCAALLRRRRRPPAPVSDQARLRVLYASQTGFAEQLARQAAAALTAAGRPASAQPLAELDAETLAAGGACLFVVSTTGEGDAPDSAFRFVQQVMVDRPSLAALRYGLLALGDRSYPRYCAFGRRLDEWLRQQGAQPLFAMLEVDNADPAALLRWQQRLGELAGTALAAWTPAAFRRWRLAERRLLNPGSAGGPVWHLALMPLESVADWQAGDIAEVQLPDGTQRDYSIASLPGDGRLELLVRESHRADGSLGAGSAWLCRDAAVGGEMALRLRENRGFHPPGDARPLILIGNGTGLAGLRALLKARAVAGQHRNWLIYGERNAACDHYYRAELQAWQAEGLLSHCDYAWSRDPPTPVYVQQLLREQAGRLRAWLAAGAAIYVCGSAQGMAQAVDATLRELLGEAELGRLIEQGRYRRDVY